MAKKFTAAAVQAAPVFMDKQSTVEKCCALIREAASHGAKLIVFPETFIPAYPSWSPDFSERSGHWIHSWVDYYRNSVTIPGEDTDKIADAAREAGAYVVVGVSELDARWQGTLYNTALFIDASGRIMGKHRKLMPTFHERLYWGQGDGSHLKVFETELGRLGGLICYEHRMTLPKYALFTKGEQIHCALWPGWPSAPDFDLRENMDITSRALSLEGQTFVVLSSMYFSAEMVPDSFHYKNKAQWHSCGGSGIISPLGGYLAGPVYDQETIVYADIDLSLIPMAKAIFDAMGHYSRWDVININLNEQELGPTDPGRAAANIRTLLAELKESLRQLSANPNAISPAELHEARSLALELANLTQAELEK
ncbi:MAG: carbon-nitrogen hydrolase family protein [Dethiobacter sp.]|jgi:predicted amidohydrolase|nr:carbon-nitrogen hydrolase family protein [Dethiobacter sp.]